jgi:hypothetical protein
MAFLTFSLRVSLGPRATAERRLDFPEKFISASAGTTIRDLNDDLLKNQFDTEFRELVEAFGRLLKLIIATIAAHGLKRIDKLFEWCLAEEYSSELANIKHDSRNIGIGYLHFWTMTEFPGTTIMPKTLLKASRHCDVR